MLYNNISFKLLYYYFDKIEIYVFLLKLNSGFINTIPHRSIKLMGDFLCTLPKIILFILLFSYIELYVLCMRNTKYNTLEELRASLARNSRNYYNKNKERIIAKVSKRYHDKKKQQESIESKEN